MNLAKKKGQRKNMLININVLDMVTDSHKAA